MKIAETVLKTRYHTEYVKIALGLVTYFIFENNKASASKYLGEL